MNFEHALALRNYQFRAVVAMVVLSMKKCLLAAMWPYGPCPR